MTKPRRRIGLAFRRRLDGEHVAAATFRPLVPCGDLHLGWTRGPERMKFSLSSVALGHHLVDRLLGPHAQVMGALVVANRSRLRLANAGASLNRCVEWTTLPKTRQLESARSASCRRDEALAGLPAVIRASAIRSAICPAKTCLLA